jgi:hypothetical protein
MCSLISFAFRHGLTPFFCAFPALRCIPHDAAHHGRGPFACLVASLLSTTRSTDSRIFSFCTPKDIPLFATESLFDVRDRLATSSTVSRRQVRITKENGGKSAFDAASHPRNRVESDFLDRLATVGRPPDIRTLHKDCFGGFIRHAGRSTA